MPAEERQEHSSTSWRCTINADVDPLERVSVVGVIVSAHDNTYIVCQAPAPEGSQACQNKHPGGHILQAACQKSEPVILRKYPHVQDGANAPPAIDVAEIVRREG